MLGVLIAGIVTMWIGYLLFREYKAQTVIFVAGIILLACAILMGKPIIAAKQSMGFPWLDIFKVIEDLLSNRVAGLGLMIMSVAGFVRYMDHIGASQAFVHLGVKPLHLFHSPYIVLALAFIVGQMMKIAIISAAGLGLLLMATMFPILIGLGVSRLSAAAVIVTSSCVDLGPAAATSQLIAKNAGIDVVTYVAQYQITVAIPVIITVAILHYFVQQWFDKKTGHVVVRSEVAATKATEEQAPPLLYAFLPLLPIIMIFIFSPILGSKIRMSVIAAMLIGLFVSMVLEYIRCRDYKKVAKSIQKFFDGMGSSFASVVSLVIAAETFAAGLTAIGAIDTIIKATQTAGFGDHAMILVMESVVAGAAVVTGSGDASIFSFAALAPAMAEQMDIDPVHMLLPMQFAATTARSLSPVSAVCIAVAGLAMVSPIDVAKRTAIPMVGALIVTTIVNFCLF